MRRQRVAAGLGCVLVGTVAVAGSGDAGLAVHGHRRRDLQPGCGAGSLLYATLGALIVRRAGNLIGWFLLCGGLSSAVISLASAYAVIGPKDAGTVPHRAGRPLAECSFVLLVGGIAYMFLLFPSGHLPSRRWCPAGGLGLLIIVRP